MDRAGTAALVVGTVMYYGIGTGIVEQNCLSRTQLMLSHLTLIPFSLPV